MNEEELRNMMYTAQLPGKGPVAIRYPKGPGVMPVWETPFKELPIGKGSVIREGNDIAIITIGHVGNFAVEACRKLEEDGIHAAHYDMRFLKPLDEELLHVVMKKFKNIITVEDGTVVGGLGSAILEFQSDHNYQNTIRRLGIPDKFISHGKQQELHHDCGYDVDGIIITARELI